MAAKQQPRVRNAVHDAAIWRQTIQYELTTAQNWERYYGFMKDAMIENEESIRQARANHTNKRQKLPPISKNQNGSSNSATQDSSTQNANTKQATKAARPASASKTLIQASGLPSKLPPGLVMPGDDPIVSDWLISYHVPHLIRARMPAEKYRTPCTTSSEVGWVWGQAKTAGKPFHDDGEGREGKTAFHTLERFPREAYGKQNILKWWGGNRESMP
ncbi:hypothetical protein HDU81_011334 [Chytriomyces hyalinus]|nr:hypothetical protein HDU81_011334 [Chytriomyces hyalinus]